MNALSSDSLLARQWFHYPSNHTDRGNLVLHLLFVPLFQLGSALLVAAPFVSPWLAFGLLGMVASLVAQGRGHRREAVAPQPFRSPFEAAGRLVAEQWIAFPRFVLTGGFARAWAASART